MKDFRNLQVWQKAHKVVLDVYKCTKHFPSEEIYGMTRQMRTAASSVPINIAEGCGRGSDADLRRFLQMAMGSTSDLEHQLQLSCELQYLSPSIYAPLNENVVEVKKMLSGLMKKLRSNH